MAKISYGQFDYGNLRSGTIIKVEEFFHINAPAYKIWADFGPQIGVLHTSAQVTVHYGPETLVGKHIIGCINVIETDHAGFTCQFILIGFSDQEGNISLATIDHNVPNGEKTHVSNC